MNYASAIIKIARNLCGNGPQVADTVYVDRLSCCRTCEFYDPVESRCKDCGCFLRIKCAIPTETCPQMRWGQAYQPRKHYRPAFALACTLILFVIVWSTS